MNKKEIQDLAIEIVGDGKTPNKYFVSISPYYMDIPNGGYVLIEGYDEQKDLLVEMFDTREEAEEFYNEQELSDENGIGIVTLEDRSYGTIKEKKLQYYTQPVWTTDEIDYETFFKLNYGNNKLPNTNNQ
jgi:hypothetical protein